MLKYKEIVNDYKNGFRYMEYEQLWHGYNVTVILDDDTVLYYMVRESDYIESMNMYKYYISFSINIKDIMQRSSYKEYIKLIDSYMYYNSYSN